MSTYRFGPFSLEKSTLLLCLDGAPLSLGPRVVETLLALVERPGEVICKADLLDRIWPEGYVEEANLAQNVYVIRKTLRAHWTGRAIETVPRRGYRFAREVTVETRRNIAVSRGGRRYGLQAAAAAMLALAIVASSFTLLRVHRGGDAAQALPDSAGRLYAMGRFYWSQRTPSGIAKSIRYFQAVLRQDPRDPRGYAGLASAYAIEADYGFGPLTAGTAFSRAVKNAQRALSLDPNCAQAHAALGLVAVDGQDVARGEAEYRRAIALDPNYATAHQWYGASLLMGGKTAEAFAELQRAADLDPASVATADWLSEASYIGRRYSDAITYARQTLDLSPQRYSGYQIIGLAYEALGNYRAAEAAYRAYERRLRRMRVRCRRLARARVCCDARLRARENRAAACSARRRSGSHLFRQRGGGARCAGPQERRAAHASQRLHSRGRARCSHWIRAWIRCAPTPGFAAICEDPARWRGCLQSTSRAAACRTRFCKRWRRVRKWPGPRWRMRRR